MSKNLRIVLNDEALTESDWGTIRNRADGVKVDLSELQGIFNKSDPDFKLPVGDDDSVTAICQVFLAYRTAVREKSGNVREEACSPLKARLSKRYQSYIGEEPTAFDLFHAIRAIASREGQDDIYLLADAGMNPVKPADPEEPECVTSENGEVFEIDEEGNLIDGVQVHASIEDLCSVGHADQLYGNLARWAGFPKMQSIDYDLEGTVEDLVVFRVRGNVSHYRS